MPKSPDKSPKKKRKRWYGSHHVKKAWKQIKDDFTHPLFDVLIVLLIGFAVWADRFQSNAKLRHAAQAGVLAFITGYFARLDLVFVSATVVFAVVMFSHRQVGK